LWQDISKRGLATGVASADSSELVDQGEPIDDPLVLPAVASRDRAPLSVNTRDDTILSIQDEALEAIAVEVYVGAQPKDRGHPQGRAPCEDLLEQGEPILVFVEPEVRGEVRG
jgi:hypothetical protein